MTALVPDVDQLRQLATRAGDDLDGASAIEILQWADEHLGRVVVRHLVDGRRWSCRISPAGCVLASTSSSSTPAITSPRRSARATLLAATMPVTVRTIEPRQSVAQQDASFGVRLYERNPDQCCALRKVTPLRNALQGYRGWASGLRRDESDSRTDIKVVEWDARRSMVKLNPIAAWTQHDVDAYIAEHGVLVNPLLFDGFGSIGCGPCTRRIKPGEDLRAGRWAGTSKTECGIHD